MALENWMVADRYAIDIEAPRQRVEPDQNQKKLELFCQGRVLVNASPLSNFSGNARNAGTRGRAEIGAAEGLSHLRCQACQGIAGLSSMQDGTVERRSE